MYILKKPLFLPVVVKPLIMFRFPFPWCNRHVECYQPVIRFVCLGGYLQLNICSLSRLGDTFIQYMNHAFAIAVSMVPVQQPFFSCHQHLTHVSKMHSGGGDSLRMFVTIVDVVTLWGEIVINFSQNWKLTRPRIPIIYHYISLYYIPIVSPEYHHRFAAESHFLSGFSGFHAFSTRCSIFSARAIAFCQKVIPSFLDGINGTVKFTMKELWSTRCKVN